MMYIFGQLLTLISYIIFWGSKFFRGKKKILIYDNISRLFAVLGFICLGTFDGVKNTIYVIVRNIIGQITDKKKIYIKITTFIIMLIILVGMYLFDYNGISTIFIGIHGLLNLYGVLMCNEDGFRIFCMIGSLFYICFMIFTANYIGALCEIVSFSVLLISYLKYRSGGNIYEDN